MRCLLIPAVAAVVFAVGCSDTMNANMNGQLATKVDGELKTSLHLDGPLQVQMQLQGPTMTYEGTYISDELLSLVKPGETGDDWVLAVFGEPNARAELRDGSSIWRWTYKPVAQQVDMIEVFSIFGGGKDDEKKEPKLATRTVFLQLRDNVVVQKWKG